MLLGKESLACPWVAVPSPTQALLTQLCPTGLLVNRAGLLAAADALVSLPASLPRKAGCAGHGWRAGTGDCPGARGKRQQSRARFGALSLHLPCRGRHFSPVLPLPGQEQGNPEPSLVFLKDLTEMLFDLGSLSFPPDCCMSV